MKTKYKSTATLLFLMLVGLLESSAQSASENPFLDRDYWAAKPSIAEIDATVSKGHSITEANGGGFDATTFAIFGDNPVSTIKYLIENGNDVNKKTHDSRTYIFWAGSRGNLEIMQYLAEKGAKMDVKDSHGYSVTSFIAASGQENPAIYEFCLEQGADLKNEKDHHGKNALLVVASRAKDLKLVDYLISKGLNIDSTDDHGNGIFHYAAQGGNIAVLKALIERGVSTESNIETGENAIIFASRGGRGSSNGMEVFEYLEGIGVAANVSTKDGTTPIHNLARSADDLKIFDYFIDKGVDPNATDNDGNTALLNAASRNKLEVIKYLAEKSNKIDHTDKEGRSALALALQSNSSDVVEYLVSKNANVNISDAEGNNLAYYLLSTRGNPRDFDAKIKILSAKGFDFKKLQANKSSVWHLAVQKNDLSLLKKINALGADINAKDDRGNTALHYAAMNTDNTEILKYLLSIGANAKSTTEFGETAHDLASENELLAKNNVNLEFLN